VADFTLFLYIILVLEVLSWFNATLTLPGIAGLILSIGMAVDANVIIFERIKEEMRAGRTVRTAVEAGFQRAFRTILDANITTLIAAGVLFYFGTGAIRGFAVTLTIGILVSMFTAIVLTRFLLRLILQGQTDSKSLVYGGEKLMFKYSYVAYRRYAYPVLADHRRGDRLPADPGLNLGIDFTGGTRLHLNIGQDFEVAEVREVLAGVWPGRKPDSEGGRRPGWGRPGGHHQKSPSERGGARGVHQGLSGRWPGITERDVLGIENVGPTIGAELRRMSFWALLVAMRA
jgi:SecD/SecF fusion protein